MFKGATGKRVYYFTSAMLRAFTAVGLLIVYIIVKFTVKPKIVLLNVLLISFAILGLISALYNLAMCGLLHDIGKIQISHKIISKPGKLTKEEFELLIKR